MKVFSKKQVILTTILAGPLPAAYLISSNYLNTQQNRASLITKIAGYFIALLTYFLVILLFEILVLPTGIFKYNRILAYSSLIFFFIVFQSVLAVFYSFMSNKISEKTIVELSENSDGFYSFIHVVPYLLLGVSLTTYLLVIGPYRFLFLIVYLLPNVYLYNHIKKIFVSKSARIIFTSIFTLLVVMFPIVMLADDYPTNIFLKFNLLVTFYYLAILLYSLLLYIIVDVILLINLKIKFLDKKTLNSKRFRRILLLSVMLITTSIIIKGGYNFNNTKVNTYNIDIPKKSGGLEHLGIVMAADTHFSEITNDAFVKQFVEKINLLKPDIVLFVGDIIETSQSNPKIKAFEEQLKQINSKYGVYAVEGNHELYSKKFRFDFFENANINILRDTVINIDNSFFLVGRKDRHNRQRKSLEEIIKQTSNSLPYILLDHQPYKLETAYNSKIDVQLSGHTHYGQIFPINYIIESIYEISWGYKKIKNTHFFVTCGAQGWGPPIKTASYSEIMSIKINFN